MNGLLGTVGGPITPSVRCFIYIYIYIYIYITKVVKTAIPFCTNNTNAYKEYTNIKTLFFQGLRTLVTLDILYKLPRSHSDTPQSEGLLWTRDRPAPETSS